MTNVRGKLIALSVMAGLVGGGVALSQRPSQAWAGPMGAVALTDSKGASMLISRKKVAAAAVGAFAGFALVSQALAFECFVAETDTAEVEITHESAWAATFKAASHGAA